MSAMDFAGAADRVRGIIASKRPDRKQESALVPNVLRDNLIAEAESRTARFRAAAKDIPNVEYEVTKTAEDGTETKEQHSFDWTSYGELLRDVARASFDWDEPELAGPNSIRSANRFNRDVLAEFMNSPEFKGSRPYTRDNEVESLFGSIAASKVLRDSASQIAAHIAASEEVRAAEQELGAATDMLDKLRQEARAKHDAGELIPGSSEFDRLKAKMQKAVKKLGEAQGGFQVAMDNANAGRAKQVQDARAVGQAMAKEHSEAVSGLSNIPGLAPGMGGNLTPDQRIELAEKWSVNKQLRDIAKMTGRLIRDMRFKRQARTKNVKVEPTGITTGRDLDVMLPHELARAYMPAMKPLFMKDYASRSLMQYEMSGKTPAGKGPIVFVYDGSGSMSGEKLIWAVSLGLALLTIAQREKRSFAAVQFGSAGQLREWFFPKRKEVDPNTVLDFATWFFGGGTDIYSGMERAREIIHRDTEFKSADVILATDGWCGYGDRDKTVRDELRAMGVRIHGISIKCPNVAYLREMCDWQVDVFDLAGSNEATDALAENIT